MTFAFAVDDLICFEYVDNAECSRMCGIGQIKSLDNRICTVSEWVPQEWGSDCIVFIDNEISVITREINGKGSESAVKSMYKTDRENALHQLTLMEMLNRRLQSLRHIQKLLSEENFQDIPAKCLRSSTKNRIICLSNIVEKLCLFSESTYIITKEDEIRFNSPKPAVLENSKQGSANQRSSEGFFFDSRWPWDPSWPTIVTSHSAYFSWSGFELILRYKPEETRNTFVAEVAFCCQVPIPCIIDTNFSATENEFSASFKVVHHPSVDPSEIDVRISQHPFWSMTCLRDASISDRHGLDRAAVYLRNMLGLAEEADSGMYFLQFLETLPKINFTVDKDAYESELLETLSLCDKLNHENSKLRHIIERYKTETLSTLDASRQEKKISEEFSARATAAETQLEKLRSEMINQSMECERLISEKSDLREKVDALQDEITALLAFHEEEMKDVEKELSDKNFEISDLLEKVEEMSLMLQDARKGEEQALLMRMKSDAEVFRLQKTIDENKFHRTS